MASTFHAGAVAGAISGALHRTETRVPITHSYFLMELFTYLSLSIQKTKTIANSPVLKIQVSQIEEIKYL